MTLQSRFDAISPLDSRFYGGDPQLYAALHPYLSEEGRVRAQAKAEAALARALAEEGIAPATVADAIAAAAERVGAAEVYAEEARIGHDVRALVNRIREQLPEDARRFVHLGASSFRGSAFSRRGSSRSPRARPRRRRPAAPTGNTPYRSRSDSRSPST